MNYRTDHGAYRDLDEDERYYATAPIDEIHRELKQYGVRVEPAVAAIWAQIAERTPRVPARLDAEAMYLEHLPSIERIAAYAARRSNLTPDETAEFVQIVRVRLLESDYRIIRKFENRSSFSTYLTTVMMRLFQEWRVREWGKWRPSAEATRRTPRPVLLSDENVLAELPSDDSAEERVRAGERVMTTRSVVAALDRAIADFSPEDRLILQLRFWSVKTAPEIARIMGLEPKKVYKRLDRLLGALRQSLESEGINHATVSELMDEAALDLSLEWRPRRGRPRDCSSGT